MQGLLAALARHGYSSLAILVFMEAIGLPVPAALALAAAGAAAAWGKLNPFVAFGVAVVAMTLGDVILFYLGRVMGWNLLGVLCRLATNPESCILLSAESFYKRGRTTLVIAKFLPAINTMAPPLAGSMKMRFPMFLRLDLAGAALYVAAFGSAGYLFSDLVGRMTEGAKALGGVLEMLLVLAVIGYAAYHAWLYWKHRVFRLVPRVQVDEVGRRVSAGEAIVIADVRSHGYYDSGAERIHGSMRLEPNNLSALISQLPRDRAIYVYCT